MSSAHREALVNEIARSEEIIADARRGAAIIAEGEEDERPDLVARWVEHRDQLVSQLEALPPEPKPDPVDVARYRRAADIIERLSIAVGGEHPCLRDDLGDFQHALLEGRRDRDASLDRAVAVLVGDSDTDGEE